ncbi:hypothetical protein [Herbaspirillum frisingense]|uniref:hypothetical protein n=1 Tax=Herbaspirillum frisingense TaxID=92645 RepID=UPI001F40C122|nr:hypothetical protein [Herbaspirillum frisingense]UIN20279.1 hypothetical protein LAZ82_17580 [Herbaspirillum frisingense]
MKLKAPIVVGILTASMTVQIHAKEIETTAPPQFTISDAQKLFENDAQPMQLAVLSQQEMKETEGAWLNFVAGGAMGFGFYALSNLATHRPITWQGSMYSIGTGALTGGMGGALIRASGGGIAGHIAWRPNILASNFSAAQYSRHRRW